MTELEGVIVGGGISGLALAHFLGLPQGAPSWELWEASDRLGGTIGTDRTDGYSVDLGPNGFLDREPLTLQLVDEIGLTGCLEPANERAEKRFIAKRGRLHAVPVSPLKLLTTPLLGPLAKARVFAEPFIPARRDGADESVFDFAARRIGSEAAAAFVDPMCSGIYGGLAHELSLPACFPVMRDMELRYGGLVKGMVSRQLEKRRAREKTNAPERKSGGPAGPGGRLTSFKGGLDVIVLRLHERLQPILRMNRNVCRISRAGEDWEVEDEFGHRTRARKVVIACPTCAAARLFRASHPDLSAAFNAIAYAAIVVVATGHKREDVTHPLDGFGFLIPRSEGCRTLGSIWTSSIFSGRAPGGYIQFRSMLGGAGDPRVMDLSDDELWAILRFELGALVGIKRDPAFLKVYRWQQGIPQFTMGHCERRARIEQLVSLCPGLFLVGNSYYGIGLNDCVKMAHGLARRILAADHRDVVFG